MGDKHCLICRDCKTVDWIEDYELPAYISAHPGHKINMVPDDAIGDAEVFEKWLKALL